MSHAAQTFEFQTDVKQLLDIVVHSLYSEKEIFVRELMSNASDALEKLRQIQLTEHDVYDPESPLEIRVTTDESANTLTIQDSGVGMTRGELVANLGTIARSGSDAFLDRLADSDDARRTLIGRFGVGFYSAFMVAKAVSVYTHSWQPGEPGHVWKSTGAGSFDVTPTEDVHRGARIVVELKDELKDFARDWKVRELLERYSAFVLFPIMLNAARLTSVQALWLRHRNEATDDEYVEFYKFQTHSYDEPRLRLHFTADVPLSIHALLFVPQQNTEQLGQSRGAPAVSLYSRRVLVDSQPKDLLPDWLRFLKGVVDSEDLPLNVSRQMMQDRSLIPKLRNVITVRFLRFLDEEATQRPDSYLEFYKEFGRFLKEGAAVDFARREPLAKLLRFESSARPAGTTTSFAAYVSRMKPDQTAIYYLIGASRAAIEAGPYVEGFRARELEVLYCLEPVDEYLMHNIRSFDDKTIVAGDHADLRLPAVAAGEDGLTDEASAALIAWLRTTLDQRVAEVRRSERLVDSPALAVTTDKLVSPHMRHIMMAMHRANVEAPIRVNLEINLRHPVIKRLSATHAARPETASLVAQQLLDNALLSAGLLDDPAAMVSRLNRLLEHV
ncbi:MAG: molecular chaperone HtpG [Gemmatimonadaceae bacterium]